MNVPSTRVSFLSLPYVLAQNRLAFLLLSSECPYSTEPDVMDADIPKGRVHKVLAPHAPPGSRQSKRPRGLNGISAACIR